MTTTQQLIEQQWQHERPKVRDYQSPTQDVLEKQRYEDRLRLSVKLSPEETPVLECSPELFNRWKNALYDYSRPNYNYDETKSELTCFRFMGPEIQDRLLSGLDYQSRLLTKNYIDQVNKLCVTVYERRNADVKARIEGDRNYQNTLDEDIKKIKESHSQKRAEANLLLSEKNKRQRVFSDAEKSKGIHLQTFSEEDLNRSKTNLLNKKLEAKKEIRDLEKKIQELDDSIKPHSQTISEIEETLKGDIDEENFKSLKSSIEFHQAQIQKLQSKILPLTEENTKLHIEVEKADKQLKLLDILIDKESLLRDAQANFPRRKERLLYRVQKLLREQAELENLRNSLNSRWRELTGDREELIGTLGLRSDSNIYFI